MSDSTETRVRTINVKPVKSLSLKSMYA